MPKGIYKRTTKHKENMAKAHTGMKKPWVKGNGFKKGNHLGTEFKKGHKINWIDGRSEKQTLKYKEKLAGRKKPEQCEICGLFGKDLKRGLFFDHDHKTGNFRGWICNRCNSILGFSGDSPELLRRLARYLEK